MWRRASRRWGATSSFFDRSRCGFGCSRAAQDAQRGELWRGTLIPPDVPRRSRGGSLRSACQLQAGPFASSTMALTIARAMGGW